MRLVAVRVPPTFETVSIYAFKSLADANAFICECIDHGWPYALSESIDARRVNQDMVCKAPAKPKRKPNTGG